MVKNLGARLDLNEFLFDLCSFIDNYLSNKQCFLQAICFNFDSLDSFLFNSTLNIHYEKIKVSQLGLQLSF